jgi:hypothetical protein
VNEGDIELNTGSAINAKVIITANRMETSGDVFINGNSDSVSSLLANLTMRLQTAQDEITTIKSEIQNLLSAETDPQVGTVTEDKWCVGSSGGQVECTGEAFQIACIHIYFPTLMVISFAPAGVAILE